MTRRVPNCVVYVEDSRIDDTGAALALADPVALDGLRITWGRTTTVDQPEPAALAVTLLDPEGGTSFLERFHVGDRIRVEATGPQWTDSAPGEGAWSANTLDSGDFPPGIDMAPGVRWSAPYQGPAPAYGRWAITPMPGAGVAGAGYAHLNSPWAAGPGVFLSSLSGVIPPIPFVRAGDPPGGWDGVRRYGQAFTRWRTTVWIRKWHQRIRITLPLLTNGIYPTGVMGGGNGAAYATGPDGEWFPVTFDSVTSGTPGQGAKFPALGLLLERTPYWDDPYTLGPTWAEADATWAQVDGFDIDQASIVYDLDTAPVDATALVFAGRVTDLDLALDDQQRPQVSLTATDVASELGNRVIGDEPWPAETVTQRCARILAAAGLTGALSLFIDSALRTVRMSYVDVDARDTLGLLQEVARSVDAVLWVAAHPTLGAYLRMEHMGSRAPLFALAIDTEGLLVIVPSVGERVLRLSACDVLADPVQFQQSVADVVNTVALTWQEQTVDADTGQPAPTERNVIVNDAAQVALLGTRRMSLATILADEAPAVATADAILGRVSVGDWRASGLALDASLLSVLDLPTALRLLDGTARNGLPVFLTDLPTWAPAGAAASVYLEGGTYTYTEGAWRLDLDVSAAQATGQALPWSGVDPTYRWQDFSPSVQWQDMAGVRPV